MKSRLLDNDTELYETHTEGKSIAVERVIRTLKNKIYKSVTSISKEVYIDKLYNIVNEYNSKCNITIKMKPAMYSQADILSLM